MKNRMLALLLALLLVPACALGGDAGEAAAPWMQYGDMADYENAAFGYSLKMFETFTGYSEEVVQEVLEKYESNRQEGDSRIFDFRNWQSPDANYRIQVQVKEQTYDSFETELAKAPDYVAIMAEDLEGNGYKNVEQLHPGILRDTPAGQMLEIAIAADKTRKGQSYRIVSLYYDFYYQDVEYIFEITGYDQSYEDTQSLLDAVVQTVQILPQDKAA